MRALLLSLVVPVAAFHLPTAGGKAPTRVRAQPIVALADLSGLEAITLAVSDSMQLPPEFAELARSPPSSGKPFSFYLMCATSVYILASAVTTFAPRVKAKITGEDVQVSAGTIAAYLQDVPSSQFGWHQADLRAPLPASVTDLYEHPIGVSAGRRVFLCSAEAACMYEHQAIEHAIAFSDHYGQPVYICYGSAPKSRRETA